MLPNLPLYGLENPNLIYTYTSSLELYRSKGSSSAFHSKAPSLEFSKIPITVGASTSQPIVTSHGFDPFSQPRNTRTPVSTQALQFLHQQIMAGVGGGTPQRNQGILGTPNQPVGGESHNHPPLPPLGGGGGNPPPPHPLGGGGIPIPPPYGASAP